MQEPSDLREQGSLRLAELFPTGIVIKQEIIPPHRVQVRIPALHRGIEDADLPYYRVALPISNTGQNKRSGSYVSIAHGTEVIVLLYDKRGYNGLVVWQVPNTDNDIHPNGYLYGYRDSQGNSFDVKDDGTMRLTGASGADITLTPQGDLTVNVKSLTVNVDTLAFTGEQLAFLFTTLGMTATDFSISAVNPVITDESGGGGGEGDAPVLTPPTLPTPPNQLNKPDL